jgi:WD40 repeat protein
MAESATHIFHSALPWSPTSSLIRNIYQRQLTGEAHPTNAVDATWDVCIRTIQVYHRVDRAVFSHNGTLIAILGMNRIKIFDAVTGACLATFDRQQSVKDIDFSHDENFLASGLHDGIVRVLDAQTGNLIRTFQGHTDTVRSVAFSPCGTMITSGSDDGTIRIWDMSSGSCKCCLEGHSDWVFTVCWSTKGHQIISGSGDGTIKIWDVSKRTCLHTIRVHAQPITSVASFQDLIASGDQDGIIKIHDVESGRVLQSRSTHMRICSVQFSTSGDKLLYTNWSSASIWDSAKNTDVSTISCDGRHAAFSPDGTYVASVDGTFVKIWKPTNGYSNTKAVKHHAYKVTAVQFAPDERVVVSRSDDNDKIWDTTSGECLFTFTGINFIVFSPNSRFVACGAQGSQSWTLWTVWNVHTRRLVRKMKCEAELVALSPDGTRMASVSYSGINLWSLATGKSLSVLQLWNRKISKILFDVDGFSILATDHDGCTMSWRIPTAPLPNRLQFNHRKSASLPIFLTPTQTEWTLRNESAPSRCWHYKQGDEWIVDDNEMRVLWVPPGRRDSRSSDVRGNKIAVGTYSGRVYMVDFSDTLVI